MMADVQNSYNKISEYLSSFIVNKSNKSTPEVLAATENLSEDLHLSTLGSHSQLRPILNQKPIGELSSRKKTTQPQSEQEFKERLSTFKFGLWTSIGISPLLCASYGWQLIEKDLLQCVTCKAVVCASLPSPSHCEAYAKFSSVLKERLKTGHKEWCGWPYNSCPSEFLHPPLHITVCYLESIIEDALKLCSLGDVLPYIDIEKFLKKLDLEKNRITFFGSQNEPTRIQLTAAVLMLTGWIVNTKKKLWCKICLRNIGLWSFLPIKEEKHYLNAKDKYLSNQELKKQKEARRMERERKRKVQEELERVRLGAEREAEEAEKKALEQAEKVRQALDKVSRLKDVESLSDCEQSDESDDEGLGEEEENNLLAENGNQNEENDEKGRKKREFEDRKLEIAEKMDQSNVAGDEGNKVDSLISNDIEKCEENESRHETKCKTEQPNFIAETKGSYVECVVDERRESTNEKSVSKVEIAAERREEENNEENGQTQTLTSEADQARKVQVSEVVLTCKEKNIHSENEDTSSSTDELWLEAVGGYNQMNDLPSTSDECEDSSRPDDSHPSSERNRKRQRTSRDRLPSDSHDKDDGVNPAKIAKFDEEQIEEMLKLFKRSKNTDEGKDPTNAVEAENESDAESTDRMPDEEDILYMKMEERLFNPLEQHHHWCGWVTDYATLYLEKIPQHVPGYKILPDQLKVLLPQLTSCSLVSSEKYAHNVEGLRAIRGILNSWAVSEGTEEDEN